MGRLWLHERGPMTVAAFMEAALYDPEFGYYARAAQRSGRAGDFFTSVDVGPLFGALLARQIAEMAGILNSEFRIQNWDLVEAGAGNGRLSADILRALESNDLGAYERMRLHLVEASQPAREAQREVLGTNAERLASSSATIPESFEGVLIANELLDAMPVHQVVMRKDGLHEVYVENVDGRLATREGPLSTLRLAEHLADLDATLEPGWVAEISLAAVDWVRAATRRLRRGFIVFIDYGHEAAELYSVTHSAGTLTSFSGHTSAGAEVASPAASWLQNPGERDLTAHVDFTSIRRAAEMEGCTTLGFLDQTYFLMALSAAQFATLNLKQRLALKTLLMPGGLGSTMKVMILGKGVGAPRLLGCSDRVRVT